MSSSIQPDVITEQDEINEIQAHEKEDEETERKLGTRFLARIDDQEAGSTIAAVNKKLEEDVVIQKFFKDAVSDENEGTDKDEDDSFSAKNLLRDTMRI